MNCISQGLACYDWKCDKDFSLSSLFWITDFISVSWHPYTMRCHFRGPAKWQARLTPIEAPDGSHGEWREGRLWCPWPACTFLPNPTALSPLGLLTSWPWDLLQDVTLSTKPFPRAHIDMIAGIMLLLKPSSVSPPRPELLAHPRSSFQFTLALSDDHNPHIDI